MKNKHLVKETLELLYFAKKNIESMQEDREYELGDAITEIIEHLEFDYE